MDQGRELKRLIDAVHARGEQRLPAELKRAVVAFARDARARGVRWTAIADAVGLHEKRLYTWLRAADASVRPGSKLIAMRVVDEPRAPHTFTLRGPASVVVDGLTLADVAVLLRELSK